jgi:hypothetical protein
VARWTWTATPSTRTGSDDGLTSTDGVAELNRMSRLDSPRLFRIAV